VPWGRFVAQDYQDWGQPKVTATEAALIQKTLAAVKPCQQKMVRYSFDNSDPTGNTIDLYFETANPRQESAHILWQTTYYHFEEGRAIPRPMGGEPDPDSGIQIDIDDNPCH
jgi:hypothetical protein